MDDDVKNLFQKFGQSTSAYREVNRDLDSEQAKQRWPLLRDIRVSEVPAHFSHDADPQSIAPAATPEAGMATPKAASPFLKHQPPVPTASDTRPICCKLVHDRWVGEARAAALSDCRAICREPGNVTALYGRISH